MKKEEYNWVRTFLSERKKIVITTHKNPDGDAMGSSLGLYHFLKKDHDVTVVTPNNYPEFLHWLPGHEDVVDFSLHEEKVAELCDHADLIFLLDYNNLERIEHLGHYVAHSKAKKILIDHHLQPADFPDIIYSDTSASSTCQMIYEFIVGLKDKTYLNKDIGTCLYTGIVTDTGSFRFDSTTSRTHQVAGDLIAAGAETTRIHQEIYDTNSYERLRFIGYCMHEKMKVIPGLGVAYITVTKQELEKFNNRKGDSEGLVNYPLSIKGIKMAALFIERDHVVKISFRSKGEFSVNDFARAHFTGGGHKNAAGGSSLESMDVTVNKFLEVIKEHKAELAVKS